MKGRPKDFKRKGTQKKTPSFNEFIALDVDHPEIGTKIGPWRVSP